ncbi:23S rRNA (uracil(1939)-C(5))-methyltransferase RlmD [Candidatus Woesearchaeota archaeon]|nr:23S rRNA (uracil(1939)-C(5))-methyltransferase RlmD [Candidatus Woesearchaeota archaeon]
MAIPPCPYFGSCGGCTAQHIPYAVQVDNKKKMLERAVKNACPVAVVTGSGYRYRNRMDFIFHPNGLGLRMKGKWHSIVDIEQCLISDGRLNHLLQEVRSFFQHPDVFDLKKHTGTFRYAVIRTPQHDSSISFVLRAESPRLAEAIGQVRSFAAVTTADNVLVTKVPADTDISVSDDYFAVKGTGMLHETLLGKVFWYSAQGFFQNNSEMAEKMQEHVHTLLKRYGMAATGKAILLDLYGGVGTFGIINSSLFSSVVVVESVPPCIEAAKKNAAENKAANVAAVLLDAAKLKRLEFKAPLFVITDPPRSGMAMATIEQLNHLKPEAIIYVSCNLQQLAKDIGKFAKYRVASAALFDLFPQTLHAEAVVELVRVERT